MNIHIWVSFQCTAHAYVDIFLNIYITATTTIYVYMVDYITLMKWEACAYEYGYETHKQAKTRKKNENENG